MGRTGLKTGYKYLDNPIWGTGVSGGSLRTTQEEVTARGGVALRYSKGTENIRNVQSYGLPKWRFNISILPGGEDDEAT